MTDVINLARDQTVPSPMVFSRRTQPKPSVVFDTYWRFAAERQAIYHRRIRGEFPPRTCDPILAQYKFTNAYRAADRVSQFLIQNVIYGSTYSLRDTVLRILLFKLFNKIDTWKLLEECVGEISEKTFSIDRFDHALVLALDSGASIYSAAYIMPSGPSSIRQPRKHRMHLSLLEYILKEQLAERLRKASAMKEAYTLLRLMPSIGPFLAYQFITDLNYSDQFQFSEMEFVVPGPGALDGIRKCFADIGDYSEAEIIRWMAERQELEFSKRDLAFETLWGRSLQLIDCQNLFCEVSKYARVAHPQIQGLSGRTRIKQKFTASHSTLRPWFPPKWKLNDRIVATL